MTTPVDGSPRSIEISPGREWDRGQRSVILHDALRREPDWMEGLAGTFKAPGKTSLEIIWDRIDSDVRFPVHSGVAYGWGRSGAYVRCAHKPTVLPGRWSGLPPDATPERVAQVLVAGAYTMLECIHPPASGKRWTATHLHMDTIESGLSLPSVRNWLAADPSRGEALLREMFRRVGSCAGREAVARGALRAGMEVRWTWVPPAVRERDENPFGYSDIVASELMGIHYPPSDLVAMICPGGNLTGESERVSEEMFRLLATVPEGDGPDEMTPGASLDLIAHYIRNPPSDLSLVPHRPKEWWLEQTARYRWETSGGDVARALRLAAILVEPDRAFEAPGWSQKVGGVMEACGLAEALRAPEMDGVRRATEAMILLSADSLIAHLRDGSGPSLASRIRNASQSATEFPEVRPMPGLWEVPVAVANKFRVAVEMAGEMEDRPVDGLSRLAFKFASHLLSWAQPKLVWSDVKLSEVRNPDPDNPDEDAEMVAALMGIAPGKQAGEGLVADIVSGVYPSVPSEIAGGLGTMCVASMLPIKNGSAHSFLSQKFPPPFHVGGEWVSGFLTPLTEMLREDPVAAQEVLDFADKRLSLPEGWRSGFPEWAPPLVRHLMAQIAPRQVQDASSRRSRRLG